LLDTRAWGDLPVGGNSLQVDESWLEDATNREAARRFLMALSEATALFHEDRELTLDVLQRWNGVSRQYAEVMYDNAAIPRKLYPCYDGIRRTMEVYDSHAMRTYKPEDFYDDSILKELDASGFIDRAYAAVKAR
jgi:NitT/TauT family transport system substrate-binding protein